MSDPELRPATAADSEFVFQVRKATLGEYVEITWGWDEDDERQRHEQRFQPEITRVIVVDGEDAGILVVEDQGGRVYLQRLFVSPAFQRRGIGARMVEHVVTEAAGRPVALRVLRSNPRALAFWQRCGFEVVGETDTHHEMRRSPE